MENLRKINENINNCLNELIPAMYTGVSLDIDIIDYTYTAIPLILNSNKRDIKNLLYLLKRALILDIYTKDDLIKIKNELYGIKTNDVEIKNLIFSIIQTIGCKCIK